MPVLSLNNVRVVEQDSSFQTLTFTVSLDAPAAAPVSFRYFTTDGTASTANRDYSARDGSATVAAGETEVTVNLTVFGDTLVEGDEEFFLFILPNAGATLAGGAAALRATATIADNNDSRPDAPGGVTGPATPIFGPAPMPGAFPTLQIHNAAYIEGASSFDYIRFLVTLDRPAPVELRVDYHTTDGSAKATSPRDYSARTGTLVIQPGQQSAYIEVAVFGDTLVEGNETFDLVLTNLRNGVFRDGAAAMVATGTIIDSDSGPPTLAGGVGGPGRLIPGPESAGPLPTVAVHNLAVIEGTGGSFDYANVLVVLDRPATAPLTFSYATMDRTASAAQRDYGESARQVTIPAGTQSTYIQIAVQPDSLIEGDESFQVVFYGIRNGQFEGQAAALLAEVTIRDDDTGLAVGAGGIGSRALPVATQPAGAMPLPILEVHSAGHIEGTGGSWYTMQFLVTLSRPATADVTFTWMTEDGTASSVLGDYLERSPQTVTIRAGEQSTLLSVGVLRDDQLEGDEYFNVILTNITNALPVHNGAGLIARGTILDDDAGTVSGPGGLGAPGLGIAGPAPGAGVVARVHSTAVFEGNSSTNTARVFVVLSEPARDTVTMAWRTVAGTATEGQDYTARTGTVTIAAGRTMGWAEVSVRGDTQIEGDETFRVEFLNPVNATFEGGLATASATVTIIDDDAGSTQGRTAETAFRTLSGTGGPAEDLRGTPFDDVLRGSERADLMFGLGGNDRLLGEGGNDTLHGGDGSDTLIGGTGDDLIFGGDTAADLRDVIYGGDGNDTIYGGAGNDEAHGGDGDDMIFGDTGADTLIGNAGNDTINGGALSDEIYGGPGDDFLNGGFGFDRLNGGPGADRFYHLGIRDHGTDWVQDYARAEGDRLVFGGPATATAADFLVQRATTPGAGRADVAEAFVTYRPTGQVLWALVDGAAQPAITVQVGAQVFDIL